MPRAVAPVVPNIDPTTLARFVDALPLPTIAKAVGTELVSGSGKDRVPLYRVSMQAIAAKLHRDLPPTSLWSYGGTVPGVQFETRRGQGLLVDWASELPKDHFLPIDHSLHGAERELPAVRSVVHLHGGKTPADSDGYPEDWYVPGQSRRYSGITIMPWVLIV